MGFRVTNSMMKNDALNNMQASLQRVRDLQNQASSGKILTKPSDNPTGINQSLQTRADIAQNAQYTSNADDGMARLGMADDTVGSMLTAVDKVRQLILQAANTGVTDTESRGAIAAELKTVKAGMVQLANTTYNGKPIFSGTSNADAAYDVSGAYLGNNSGYFRTVGPNASVQVNMTGPELFSNGSTSLFAAVDQAVAHLEGGTEADLGALATGSTSDLAVLDTIRVNMQNRHSEIGARYHRVETMSDRASQDKITLAQTLSGIEDADAAETYMQYQSAQSAYQAALAVTARTIQPSLLNFLS